jgi:hypothetical protein
MQQPNHSTTTVVAADTCYFTYFIDKPSVGRLSIGVATMANKKALFVMLVDRVPRFEVH